MVQLAYKLNWNILGPKFRIVSILYINFTVFFNCISVVEAFAAVTNNPQITTS